MARKLFTRRDALGCFGALALGAALAGCGRGESTNSVNTLDVAEDDVVTLEGFTQVKNPSSEYKVEDVATLPAGALLSASGTKVAAALCKGENSSPLSTVSLVGLKDGLVTQVLGKAVGHDEGYSIYGATASGDLLLWVESDYLNGSWRVYSAPVERKTRSKQVQKTEQVPMTVTDADGNEVESLEEVTTTETVEETVLGIGKPQQLDEGDSLYDAPEIAVIDEQAYWIVQPAENGERAHEDSLLKMAGGAAVTTICTSHGRFNGGLSVSGKVLCAMPRADAASSVYYQLTAFQGGAVTATQVMPRSFKPGNAIYMDGAFSFAIPASYDYGGGIANVGTYYPMPNGQWLRLTRQPVTPAGLCKDWLYCKSGSRTVFVDMKTQRYFTIDPPADSASQGDFQVCFGEVSAVYNYATVEKVKGKDIERSVLLRRITPKQA